MRVSTADTVEVVKFKETGVVALCLEVVGFAASEDGEKVDLTSGRLAEDEHCFKVVFDRIKEVQP
jgi:hypothetical protein